MSLDARQPLHVLLFIRYQPRSLDTDGTHPAQLSLDQTDPLLILLAAPLSCKTSRRSCRPGLALPNLQL